MSETNNNAAAAPIEQTVPAYEDLSTLTKSGLIAVATQEDFLSYSVECQSGSNVGDGFVGIVMKVTIRGTKSNAPGEHELNVLCKIQHLSKARRDQVQSYKLFEREVMLYKEYLPFIEQFQKSYGLDETDGFFNYPKCYFADVSPEDGEAVIIMEDLRNRGFTMANKYKPLIIETCEIVIKTLARLHAASFASRAENPEEFKKFTELKCVMEILMLQPMLIDMFNGLFDNAINSIEGHPGTQEKLRKMKENFRETFLWLIDDKNSGDYSVVGHGDSWVNNFLFKFNEDETPVDIALIDWQISRYASPVLDLSYFIFTATDKALRDEHMERLMDLYYVTLSEQLRKLNCEPDEVFPRTEYKQQWQKFGKFGMLMAMMVVPIITTSPDQVVDMEKNMEKMADPNYDPMKDPVIQEMMAENAKRVEDRIRGIVLDQDRLGFI